MAEVEELRVQPQDILAEQSVLGAIFIDESKLVFVREYIDSRDFFKYAHRLIFQAMVDLSDRGEAIDATTVRTILDSQGDLQNIGGLSYLVEIINSVPTSANAEYYAKIVAEKATLRRLIAKLTESVNQAYEASSPADEISQSIIDALGIPTLGTMPRAGASSCTAQALESLTHSHWQYGLSQQQVLEAAHSWDSPLCDEDPQERMSQILAHLRNMS